MKKKLIILVMAMLTLIPQAAFAANPPVTTATNSDTIIIGDSRIAGMYREYPDWKNVAMFSAYPGGRYSNSSTIIQKERVDAIKSQINRALAQKGRCKVIIYGTINDRNSDVYANHITKFAKSISSIEYKKGKSFTYYKNISVSPVGDRITVKKSGNTKVTAKKNLKPEVYVFAAPYAKIGTSPACDTQAEVNFIKDRLQMYASNLSQKARANGYTYIGPTKFRFPTSAEYLNKRGTRDGIHYYWNNGRTYYRDFWNYIRGLSF